MGRRKWYAAAAAAVIVVGATPVLLGRLTTSSQLGEVSLSKSAGDWGPAPAAPSPPSRGGSTVGQASTQIITQVSPLGRIAESVRGMFYDDGSASRTAQAPSIQAKESGGSAIPGLADRPVAPIERPSEPMRMAEAEAVRPPPPAAPAQTRAPAMGYSAAPAPSNALSAPKERVAPPPYVSMPVQPVPGYAGDAYPNLPEQGRDRFESREENPFKAVRSDPVSTFSLDVDTASYGFLRASLARNAMPAPASVRTEEVVNYFPYAYPAPDKGEDAFRATVSVMPSPWNAGRKLVHVGIKAYEVPASERPRANLVFLVDTSGSMGPANRLPLAKQALSMLVRELRAGDTVGIVTYAGSAGIALMPTDASDAGRILSAIEALQAGGGTAGGEGIRQAYALAERNFDKSAVNRIMLATDGDFNIGISSPTDLKTLVERKRDTGIYLSVLGFGMGNYQDTTMQALAQNGNGVAAYIDSLSEARKVLVQQATSAVVPVADDAKAQVEFNPATVAEYRLVGYEKRALRREDFNNDKVDAGEIGSGHTVTVLYEIVPVGARPGVDPLRYGAETPAPAPAASGGDGYGFVKLRYKRPGAKESTLLSVPVNKGVESETFDAVSQEARFAVSAAGFAELLKGGRHTGGLTYDDVIRTAQASRGDDPFGYRTEFVQLVRNAKYLQEGGRQGR